MNREQYKCVALSTAHLSRTAVFELELFAIDSNNNMVMERDSGWFIKLYGDGCDKNKYTRTLQAIVNKMVSEGYLMIEFDCDVLASDDFKVYAW